MIQRYSAMNSRKSSNNSNQTIGNNFSSTSSSSLSSSSSSSTVHTSYLQSRFLLLPILFFLAFVAISVSNVWDGNSSTESRVDDENNRSRMFPRLAMYCAKEQILGEEVIDFDWKTSKQFKLKKLVFTIRHGDRSSIHKIPNSNIDLSKILHHKNSLLLDPEATRYAPALANLTLNTIGASSIKMAENMTVGLDPYFLYHGSDYHIAPGQLTSRGFMQHIHLGRLINRAYREFLGPLSASEIYIRSTNYLRTIRSVGAFVISAFPHLILSETKVKVNVHASELDEVMHGIGLRSSSHNQKNADHGEHEVVGQCKPAVDFARSQKKKFNFSRTIVDELSSIFGSETQRMGATDIADATLPPFCHSLPLPCSVLGDKSSLRSTKCLDENRLDKLMIEADRYYCNRFTGKDGGQKSTNLSIYPFVHEVLRHLSPHLNQNHPEKVTIFSGHDTVIAPVLSGLGVYRGKLCRWPQYASRIIFELWEIGANEVTALPAAKLSQAASIYLTKHPGNDVGSAELNTEEMKRVLEEKYFVRVLFNGEDVTQRIPTCVSERKRIAESYSKEETSVSASSVLWSQLVFTDKRFSLCSLVSFTKQIQSMIAPHSTISEACEWK